MHRCWALVLAGILLLGGCSWSPQPAREYSVGTISSIDAQPRRTGGDCFFYYGSQLIRIDVATGDVTWATDVPFTDRGPYVNDDFVVTTAGFTSEYQPGLIAVDHDGQPQWRSVTPLGGPRVFGRIDGDLLVWTNADDRADLLRLDMSGTLVWQATVDASLFSGPLLVGDRIVTTTQDNALVTLDATTGEILSTRQLPYEFSGPGLAFDNLAILAGYEGRIAAVDVAGNLREYPVGGHPYWIHSLVDGIVICSDEETLAGLALDGGDVLWRDTGDWDAGVVVDGGSLIVPGIPRGVRSLDAVTGQPDWQFFGQSGDLVIAARAGNDVAVGMRLGTEVESSYLLAMIDPEITARLGWDSPLPGRPTTIAYRDGRLIVGGTSPGDTIDVVDDPAGGWLRAYDPASGDVEWDLILRDAPAKIVSYRDETFLLTADPTVGCE